VRIKRGPFQSYGWPAFAFAPPQASDAATRLLMLKCLRFADLGLLPPPYHRVRIGADGTWHTFLPEA
jgi:hypothetical protein